MVTCSGALRELSSILVDVASPLRLMCNRLYMDFYWVYSVGECMEFMKCAYLQNVLGPFGANELLLHFVSLRVILCKL